MPKTLMVMGTSLIGVCAKRAPKNCAQDARNLSGASFLSKTAQAQILLASVRLGSSYSPKASHSPKLDFLARAAQIDVAEAPAQARDHQQIGP